MIGFEVIKKMDVEFIDLFIEDEACGIMFMNKENMQDLKDSLINNLLAANEIMKERGWI